jgi:hypothetical protein
MFGGTHMINICELLEVISVKVQVITPWRWILCDPKHVGVIFNYVSFKLLYDMDFNIYVLYNWVHESANKSDYVVRICLTDRHSGQRLLKEIDIINHKN